MLLKSTQHFGKNAIRDPFSGQFMFSGFLDNGSLEKAQTFRVNISRKVE